MNEYFLIVYSYSILKNVLLFIKLINSTKGFSIESVTSLWTPRSVCWFGRLVGWSVDLSSFPKRQKNYASMIITENFFYNICISLKPLSSFAFLFPGPKCVEVCFAIVCYSLLVYFAGKSLIGMDFFLFTWSSCLQSLKWQLMKNPVLRYER